MDKFLTYILMEMSAEKFAEALRQTTLPREEQERLVALAEEREGWLIYLHVMYPNDC